jgi:hypothetical protein
MNVASGAGLGSFISDELRKWENFRNVSLEVLMKGEIGDTVYDESRRRNSDITDTNDSWIVNVDVQLLTVLINMHGLRWYRYLYDLLL